MMLDLDELSRLCEAATPGPWEARLVLEGYLGCDRRNVEIRYQVREDHDPESWDNGHRKKNAAFIAAARTALPELIELVRKLKGNRSIELHWFLGASDGRTDPFAKLINKKVRALLDQGGE